MHSHMDQAAPKKDADISPTMLYSSPNTAVCYGSQHANAAHNKLMQSKLIRYPDISHAGWIWDTLTNTAFPFEEI